MRSKAEFASSGVEGSEQLVGHGVAVGVEEVARVVRHLARVVPHGEAARVRRPRLRQSGMASVAQ